LAMFTITKHVDNRGEARRDSKSRPETLFLMDGCPTMPGIYLCHA